MALMVIPATVLARFGPWFGRAVASKPDLLASLVNRIRQTGATIGASVSDVIAYVKTNSLNAAMVFSTLATLGAGVSSLFNEEDTKDPDVAQTAAQLAADTVEAWRKITGAADASATLAIGDSADSVEARVLREVVGYANRFFGGRFNALEAHSMMQAFFELPRKDVEFAFENLKLS